MEGLVTTARPYTVNDLNDLIKSKGDDFEKGKISDGYHTFDELYEHRIVLYIALALSTQVSDNHSLADQVWRSKKHSDGSEWEGWFLLGIGKDAGTQITYHLPISKWDETNFAEDLDKAPDFDGHTSADVLDRIKKL